ncbi:MAG: hypothetical protein LW834_08060 [Cyanobium sp. 49614_E6]|jgi:hypothetical protein|nr:hypothetical protein [Cyanobium sp. 49614_E6]
MADQRRELARQLFGLTDGSEAQTKMAARISEAILSDLIQHAQKAWQSDGPGVLVIRRTVDDARWSPVQEIQNNLTIAERHNDAGMIAALRSTLERLGSLDIDTHALVAFADHKGFRLLQLPVVNPAGAINELLSSWNA